MKILIKLNYIDYSETFEFVFDKVIIRCYIIFYDNFKFDEIKICLTCFFNKNKYLFYRQYSNNNGFKQDIYEYYS